MPTQTPWRFPWPQAEIADYIELRATSGPQIDGKVDETCWLTAPRSPRFRDLVSGGRAIQNTQAALLCGL